ncbi:MAG: SDR family oxidoreductase [Caldicoprobacter oshimai]|uniref:NAD(P)-dependent dehydrogenase, short-chain alcohol dehydrogenase family n=1 Tax=Caldicoprobacter faecalis TaxID=937334 RepID=A0A1I5SA59_9FIRM|nr:SDR family oxidoreductase [Caldicoprobacter faecalis]PZN12082.1 MAG: SDR family oxidoreductase [Caldicoprobacter oshimai]SFP67678.1 NAD(P)-dependent dehydrogenase, short-chain alcohol dehydrogenase family [Caldicoprobacter faecalis]
MEPTAVITGADRGFGFALCEKLLEKGWRVFAGQYMPSWPQLSSLSKKYPEKLHIISLDVSSNESVKEAAIRVSSITNYVDMLVNNAGIISPYNELDIREHLNYEDMHRIYDVNALGPIRMVEAFLPLMDKGRLKRLCFVSSEAGSIGACTRKAWYGYCMSKAALNMAVKITFNRLRPEGYTFRLYHPGWMRTYMSGKKNYEADMEPEEAAVYALQYFLSGTPYSERDIHIDEDRLVLMDYNLREWPW